MNMGTRYTITEGVLRFAEDITDLNNIALKENKPFIEEIIIPDSIERICARVFADCVNLRVISFGANVSIIENEAFRGCCKLESLDLPESLAEIWDGAFMGCTGLKSLSIPTQVKSVGRHAFKDCSGMERVHVGKSVSFMLEDAFEGCQAIESFTVDPANSTYDSRENCHSLVKKDGYRNGGASIHLMSRNSFIPDGIRYLGSVVYKGYERIQIPESVVEIGLGCFSGCSKLTSIRIPRSVKYIGKDAFEGCSNLTDILIPNSVIMVGAFYMGYGLFAGCTSLKKIEVEPGCRNLDSRDGCNGIVATHTNSFLSGCDNSFIPDSITEIEGYAFYGCKGLKSIMIPASVTRIGDWAFADCCSLKTLSIPDSVTSIGGFAFAGCTSLEAIILPSRVKAIPVDILENCPSLSAIYVPKDRRKYYVSRFYNIEPRLFKSYEGQPPQLG